MNSRRIDGKQLYRILMGDGCMVAKLIMKSVRVNLPVELGPITVAKREKIDALFGGRFTVAAGEESGGIIFFDPEHGCNMFVHPRQVTFGYDRQNFEIDYALMEELFRKTFDALLLDKEVLCVVNLIGHIPIESSAMERSLQLFVPHLNESIREELSIITGVGLRFFESDGKSLNEYRIEPFLQDDCVLFTEAAFNSSEKMDMDKLALYVRECYESFTGRFWTYIKNRLIE